MSEERIDNTAAEDAQPVSPADEGDFSAAAPPGPHSAGKGETNFADAEAPPAGEGRPTADAEPDPGAKYLELAKRTQADFENYRKRMARENAAAAERGAARLAKELLPALDHLELALKAAGGHTQPASPAGTGTQPASPAGTGTEPAAPAGTGEDLVKGFAMVRDELNAALAKVGIQAFSPHGEPFDPNEHEAMAQQPSDEAESGTVLEVYQQGYRVNGAVLRPARVVVAQ